MMGKIIWLIMWMTPPTFLMMEGYNKMREVQGPFQPYALGLYLIGIWVVGKGAAELVE